MLTASLRQLRRLHPLHRLRRVPASRRLLEMADVAAWARPKGLKWPVRVRLVSHASFILLGSPERAVTEALEALLAEPEIRRFWDIGSNFGYYTWLAKSVDPEIAVTAFEPNPANLELLYATQERHRLPGVEIVAAATSDTDGVMPLSLPNGDCLRGTLEDAGHVLPGIDVRVIALDTLDAAVDLMKIDVEGHEEAVLRGAEETIARHRPTIVLECHHDGLPAVRWLEERGYVARNLDGENFLLVPGTAR